MLFDYGARVTTAFLECFFSGDASECLPSELAVYPRDVADLAVCNAHQLAARTANAVAALMSPVFGEIYDAAGVNPRNAAYTTEERVALMTPYRENSCETRATQEQCLEAYGTDIVSFTKLPIGGSTPRTPIGARSGGPGVEPPIGARSGGPGVEPRGGRGRGPGGGTPKYVSQSGETTSMAQHGRTTTTIGGFPTDSRDFDDERKKEVFVFTSAQSMPDILALVQSKSWTLEFSVSDFYNNDQAYVCSLGPCYPTLFFGFGFSGVTGRFADMRIVGYGTSTAYLYVNNGESSVVSNTMDMTVFSGLSVNVWVGYDIGSNTFSTSITSPGATIGLSSATPYDAVFAWNPDPSIDSVVFGYIPSESEMWRQNEFVLDSAYIDGRLLQRPGLPDWAECDATSDCKNPYAECLKSNVYNPRGRCLTPGGCRWAALNDCTTMEPACFSVANPYPDHNFVCNYPTTPGPPYPIVSDSFTDDDAKKEALTFELPGGISSITSGNWDLAFTISGFQVCFLKAFAFKRDFLN